MAATASIIKALKGLLLVILILTLSLSLSLTVAQAEQTEQLQSKVKTLHEWINTSPEGSSDLLFDYYDKNSAVYIRAIQKEDDISKFDFRWRWDIHMLSVYVYKYNNGTVKGERQGASLNLTVWQYQELTSAKSRQYILWIMGDRDLDGKVDSWSRSYNLLRTCDNDGYYELGPDYPEGFRNMQWSRPPEEEAQALFEKTVNFWMQFVQ